MRRRSRGGRLVKRRPRKTPALKRLRGSKAARPRRSSTAGLESEAARLASELSAMSEVLRLISNSQGELEPVFQATLEKAARICETKFGNVYRCDGEALDRVAWPNTPSSLNEQPRRAPARSRGKT